MHIGMRLVSQLKTGIGNNVLSIAILWNVLQCIVVLLLLNKTIAITIVGSNDTILLQYIAIVLTFLIDTRCNKFKNIYFLS